MSLRGYVKRRKIRYFWSEEHKLWFFVINDFFQIVANVRYPYSYSKSLRKQDKNLSGIWNEIVNYMDVKTTGGVQKIACTTATGLIIISNYMNTSRNTKVYCNWIRLIFNSDLKYEEKLHIPVRLQKRFYQILVNADEWANREKKFLLQNKSIMLSEKQMIFLEIVFMVLRNQDIHKK
jgi:hypothetical protein